MTVTDSLELIIENQTLRLLPEKVLFWENEGGLIISDVHLGKAGHFRRNGIALPQSSDDDNLDRISHLIHQLQPNWILFLGDLFHSEKNEEWNLFRNWRSKHSELDIYLVLGNHEFYPEVEYSSMGIMCLQIFDADPFLFIHDENSTTESTNRFVISGHIHPAIRLKGKGRQSVRIPCFYFEERKAILPAFGKLTGTYAIKPSRTAKVFGVLEDQIMQIQ